MKQKTCVRTYEEFRDLRNLMQVQGSLSRNHPVDPGDFRAYGATYSESFEYKGAPITEKKAHEIMDGFRKAQLTTHLKSGEDKGGTKVDVLEAKFDAVDTKTGRKERSAVGVEIKLEQKVYSFPMPTSAI
ncbi:MAG: hypothetical protein ACE5ES_03455 [Candidatus Nanoarchaeia archaeon]